MEFFRVLYTINFFFFSRSADLLATLGTMGSARFALLAALVGAVPYKRIRTGEPAAARRADVLGCRSLMGFGRSQVTSVIGMPAEWFVTRLTVRGRRQGGRRRGQILGARPFFLLRMLVLLRIGLSHTKTAA